MGVQTNEDAMKDLKAVSEGYGFDALERKNSLSASLFRAASKVRDSLIKPKVESVDAKSQKIGYRF